MAIRSRLPAPVLALLVVIPLLAVAHQARPTPYGDHLTVPRAAPARVVQATPRLRTRDTALWAHDPRTGALRWRYTREGRRPLTSLHVRGDVITLWDDGLVTGTDGRTVRWHRALPAPGDWLPTHGGTGVLRPLGRGMLAVVTPHRIAAYRIADGDLRWVLPARDGCAFRPERAVHHAKTLIVAQPCRHAAWTAQLIALDDLGRIAPHRRPLGNEVRDKDGRGRGRPRVEHPDPEKVLAQPR
ncbi:PQQ-like beta-propeller repeat protein [Streptomyces sp. AC550_RSS872]|uniref:PQQ-like beta-propeller repeat protein n=1 Tax=Streptomyces sp. AC550_RSS872 TaxID=2823689 RepID=UPI001C27595F|nr:PQQ-like beta-propeller repeat protein [Streptomyces sp. AC550_RSS872]